MTEDAGSQEFFRARRPAEPGGWGPFDLRRMVASGTEMFEKKRELTAATGRGRSEPRINPNPRIRRPQVACAMKKPLNEMAAPWLERLEVIERLN